MDAERVIDDALRGRQRRLLRDRWTGGPFRGL